MLTWNVETQTYDLPDWHRRQLNKKLVEEYPFLLPRILSTDTISDDYDYQYTLFDDIPPGWREEFGIEMCEEMKKVLEKYNMLKKNVEQKIHDLLATLRIYINADGGDVEFVSYKNKVLTLRILGQCASCPFVGNTFDEGVKLTILNEIKEVKDVKFIY